METLGDNTSPGKGNDDAKDTETQSNAVNSMETTETSNATKLSGKLAPEPPRWRFVTEAKSTLGYSSKYAGVTVRGLSSTELGAKYIAPEITKDIKVRTIEQFDRAIPDEKEPAQKEIKEVGKLTIHEWESETEDFVGVGGWRRRLDNPSISEQPDPSSFPEYSKGENTNYEHDPVEVISDCDGEDEDMDPSSFSFTDTYYNSQHDDFFNHDHIEVDSIADKQRNCRRCYWMLFPLLLLLIIVGTVSFVDRGDDDVPLTGKFVFEGSETMIPSQSPTFPPTERPSLIPSIMILPSMSPSSQPSKISSREPSSNPTATPSKIPSYEPTLQPSIIPTLRPSIPPSMRPSVSPTQLPSKSNSPTRIGSLEPSLSLKPSVHHTDRPSSIPSSHPTTTSPSKQPIKFIGGCPESFTPFTLYTIDQTVSRDDVVYICISNKCGNLLFAPGLDSNQWQGSWEVLGACDGTKLPTASPAQFPSINPTEAPTSTLAPTNQPIMFIGGCPRVFDPFDVYYVGSRISFEGVIYECISLPCTWRDAWKVVGSCKGTIAPTSKASVAPSIMSEMPSNMPTPAPLAPTMTPTNNPTPAPLAPTMIPTNNPTSKPSIPPSSHSTIQPSEQPTKLQSLSPTRRPTLNSVAVATPRPTCPPQNGDFNLCIALDMSGSVCGSRGTCSFCQPLSSCNSFGINRQRCCNNFDNVLEFSKDLVRALGDLKTQQDFSIVHFATEARIASTLQNANQAIKTLHRLEYTGGATNLGDGIALCQQTLDSSTSGRKNLIVIVSDGYPSEPIESPREAARRAAFAAKSKGTFVIPIFIERLGLNLNDPAIRLMKEISSDSKVFLTDFDTIVSLEAIIFEQVICNA